MYGTIARLQVRPGVEGQLREAMATIGARQVPGFVGSYLYRMEQDDNTLMLAVLFTDRERTFGTPMIPPRTASIG